MKNVRSEEVKLVVDGVDMPTYLALPEASGPRPVVILFQEIFGINGHMREVADRLAAEGYVVIAPDYHHRAWTPGTVRDYSPESMKLGMQVVPKLTFEGITHDVDACLAYLKTRKEADTSKLGAMGFCIGGHMAYLMAATRPIAATASFYGGGIAVFGPGGGKKTVELTGDIKGKMLCLFGDSDPMIPAEQVATIRKALTDAQVRHDVVVYEGASHAFFCDKPERHSYVEAAAKDAWERVKRLFKEELG